MASLESTRRPSGGCSFCKQLSVAARQDVEKYLSRNKKRFGEISAATTCRVCGGVVVLSLTDLDQKQLSYVDLRNWFLGLHTAQMQCVGKSDHVEPQGWGYYWNLDGVLRKVYPGEYEEDIEKRGISQFFGVEIPGTTPRVHILRTAGPLAVDVVRRNKPKTRVNFLD